MLIYRKLYGSWIQNIKTIIKFTIYVVSTFVIIKIIIIIIIIIIIYDNNNNNNGKNLYCTVSMKIFNSTLHTFECTVALANEEMAIIVNVKKMI